jgi:hypothetical protein
MVVANKCKSLVSATSNSLDPTPSTNAAYVENDTATAIILNCSRTKLPQKLMAPLLAATARAMLGNPIPQYLNAHTIAANQAIADTGAASMFIMEGADMVNKQVTTSPLTINLPDSKKIQSTHVCDIHIPGLPTVLVFHSHCCQLRPSLELGSFAKPAAQLCLTMKNARFSIMETLFYQV